MRYLIVISIVVILLAGCKREEMNANKDLTTPLPLEKLEELTPVVINETLNSPIIKEKTYLYLEDLVIEDSNERIVIVRSNVDMDQKSLEQALEHSLIKSIPDSDLRYTLEWASPTFLLIRFQVLDADVFSFMFSLDKATTIDGDLFESEDPPNRNKLVILFNGDQPSISLRNPQTGESKVLPAWDGPTIKAINVNGTNDSSFLFNSGDEHHLLNIVANEIVTIPSNTDNGLRINDYGYYEMFSNRFYNGYTYMVVGSKTLYRIDLNNFNLQKLREFDLPVYGISSSPDGNKIAILQAHDDYIGPSADLIILDKKGNMIDTYENAAHLSHSDGFLFEYPLSWLDDTHLILPADSNEDNLTGKVVLNLNDKQMMIIKDERISDQLIEDIFSHINEQDYMSISSLFWSPDGSVAVFRATSNQIWIYSADLRTFEFLGVGEILGWLSNGNLVYMNTQNQVVVF